MNQPTLFPSHVSEEWLRVLGKGMVTLPKTWREELGITPGNFIKAKRVDNTVVLTPSQQEAPYRVYSDEEIDRFLVEDQLSSGLKKRITTRLNLLKK